MTSRPGASSAASSSTLKRCNDSIRLEESVPLAPQAAAGAKRRLDLAAACGAGRAADALPRRRARGGVSAAPAAGGGGVPATPPPAPPLPRGEPLPNGIGSDAYAIV